MFFSCPALRLLPFVHLHASLTPPRTASGQTAALRCFHIPNVAAMRWRGGLGSFLLRDCSLTLCCLSSCSFCLSLHSVLLFLLVLLNRAGD